MLTENVTIIVYRRAKTPYRPSTKKRTMNLSGVVQHSVVFLLLNFPHLETATVLNNFRVSHLTSVGED